MGVSLTRRDQLPEAMLALVLRAGSASVGSEQAGLASLVAKVLPEGAGGRGSREMAVWLDGMGAHLGIGVGYDSMVLRLHTLSESLEPALDALAAVVMRPDFLEAEVERCKAERLDSIRRSRDEPAEVAADVMADLLYGGHPYGRLSRGREDTVESLGRDDLVKFHGGRFDPGTATLVGCGDLPAGFDDSVVRRFESWTASESTLNAAPSEPAAAAPPGIVLVDRPGSAQSEIRVGAVGMRRGDPAESAARVAVSILGGLFNSRLNMNLREDKGWTYGARCGISLRRAPGPLTMRAAVETAVTGAAIREMLGEASKMRDSLPTEQEMETAAGALVRSLPLRFETNSQVAGRIAEQVIYDLPDDYWSTYASRIESLSRDDVRDVSHRLLDPDGLVVLVVGDAAAVLADLESLGPVTMREAP
jgi:zinc protease